MKQIFILLSIAILCSQSIVAQEEQKKSNQFTFGGNLGLYTEKLNDYYEYEEKTTSFNIKPVFGYFVAKNVVVGVSCDFVLVEDDKKEWESNAQRTLSAMLFARYQGVVADNFKYYIEPNIGRKYNLNEKNLKSLQANVDFGLMYFFNDNISIEIKMAGLSYLSQSDDDSDELIRVFDISYDLVKPNFGLRYYF
jgi:hypothetical protein